MAGGPDEFAVGGLVEMVPGESEGADAGEGEGKDKQLEEEGDVMVEGIPGEGVEVVDKNSCLCQVHLSKVHLEFYIQNTGQ